jgi:hypothetical protein
MEDQPASLIPFKSRSIIMVAASTGAGKTRWVCDLLRNASLMFEEKPHKIMYCYTLSQPILEDMAKTIDGFSLHVGVPSLETMELFADGRFNIICLDDLMHQLASSQDIELLVTQFCNHRNLTAILLQQNLFYQGPKSRTIALNCHYFCLLKSPRQDQLRTLARQLYPSKTGVLIEAYNDAISMAPIGAYLIIDMHPRSCDDFRLRTKIFPGDDTIVYMATDT